MADELGMRNDSGREEGGEDLVAYHGLREGPDGPSEDERDTRPRELGAHDVGRRLVIAAARRRRRWGRQRDCPA